MQRLSLIHICLEDELSGLCVPLLYGVLPERDVITRAVKLENRGHSPLERLKVQTVCLDFLYGDYDLISFYGRHAMERNYQRTAVSQDVYKRQGAGG